jgi:uncharacterized protein YceH (UPF0502 family)
MTAKVPARGCTVPIVLSANEIRVIGCLLEKAATTPDQYPLSLNALTNACNQKSNRDPVLELDERTVQETLDALMRKHLVLERSGFGSRVPKYQQRFCNTGFGSLEFNPLQTAILCELMLRGPQSPGELRGRVGRMCELPDPSRIEVELAALAARADGPFIVNWRANPASATHVMHSCSVVTARPPAAQRPSRPPGMNPRKPPRLAPCHELLRSSSGSHAWKGKWRNCGRSWSA